MQSLKKDFPCFSTIFGHSNLYKSCYHNSLLHLLLQTCLTSLEDSKYHTPSFFQTFSIQKDASNIHYSSKTITAYGQHLPKRLALNLNWATAKKSEELQQTSEKLFILQVISRKCPTFECCGLAGAFVQVSKSPDRASIAAESSVGFCNNFNSEVTQYAIHPTVKLMFQEFMSALNIPFLKKTPYLSSTHMLEQRCLFDVSKIHNFFECWTLMFIV